MFLLGPKKHFKILRRESNFKIIIIIIIITHFRH